MMTYTHEERVFFVKTFYECNKSYISTLRQIRATFGYDFFIQRRTIQKMVRQFEETGSVVTKRPVLYHRGVRNEENIDRVRDSIVEDAMTSVRRRSQELNISRSTLGRILKNDLSLKPFKIRRTQELKLVDHQSRKQFAEQMILQQSNERDFFNRILFSDEAHFELQGYVNSQNFRFWRNENPRAISERSNFPKKLTVWCGLWSGGVIGPYFFEDADGTSLTVNSARYQEMLLNFVWPAVDTLPEESWFQQDGAPCHTARTTMDILRQKFPERLISRNGIINWPPRSCDLNPLDFFLWGYIKDKVYENKPNSISHLKEAICHIIGTITSDLCHRVIENFERRIHYCAEHEGGHTLDFIFHN